MLVVHKRGRSPVRPHPIGSKSFAPVIGPDHTEEMITVSLETWVSLAAIAVFAIAMFTYLDKKFDMLRVEIYQLATGSTPRPLIVPPR